MESAAYIKYDEVEEDKEDVHHDPHDELQLADHPPGILQGVRQVLAFLVYLVRQHTSCSKPGVMCGFHNLLDCAQVLSMLSSELQRIILIRKTGSYRRFPNSS